MHTSFHILLTKHKPITDFRINIIQSETKFNLILSTYLREIDTNFHISVTKHKSIIRFSHRSKTKFNLISSTYNKQILEKYILVFTN